MARENAGNKRAAKIPIEAMTTSNSIRVNAKRFMAYIIFNFSKPCESTRPTGSCFAFTTIKSSTFRSQLFECGHFGGEDFASFDQMIHAPKMRGKAVRFNQ